MSASLLFMFCSSGKFYRKSLSKQCQTDKVFTSCLFVLLYRALVLAFKHGNQVVVALLNQPRKDAVVVLVFQIFK